MSRYTGAGQTRTPGARPPPSTGYSPHGNSRMLRTSPARRIPPHAKGARHVQRGGRFLMCGACAMQKRESCLLARLSRVGAASYALCGLRKPHPANTTLYPQTAPCYIKLPCCRSRILHKLHYLNPTPLLHATPAGSIIVRQGISRYTQKTGHRRIPMTCFPLCRRLPIFPGRFQPSIFGASELNCRVRDGNGCTLTAISTDYIYQRVFHPMISASASFIP